MTPAEDQSLELDRKLAALLRQGTRLATFTIAAGLAATLGGGAGAFRRSGLQMHVVAAGLLLFILLPVVRVAFMLAAFLRMRDRVFAAVAAAVLCVIVIGTVCAALWPT